MAQTSSYPRENKPQGVPLVILHMSLMNPAHMAALDMMKRLSDEFPDANWARVCKEFKNGPEVLKDRMVEESELPAFEYIMDNKRVWVELGTNDGDAVGAVEGRVTADLEGYGLRSVIQRTVRDVVLELFDKDGQPVPFGWRRDIETNTVLSTKPGKQADLAGVKKGWMFDAVNGAKVLDDEGFEAAMASAKATAAGQPNSLVTVSFRVTTDLRFEKENFSISSAAALAERAAADRKVAELDFFGAEGDTIESGNMKSWETPKKVRLTNSFFPSQEVIGELAEKWTQEIENMTMREVEGEMDQDGNPISPDDKKRKGPGTSDQSRKNRGWGKKK